MEGSPPQPPQPPVDAEKDKKSEEIKKKVNPSENVTNDTDIEDTLAESKEENEIDIPAQYKGLDSDTIDAIWTIPEYIDREKTRKLKERKTKAIATLRKKEADDGKIEEIRSKLEITKPVEELEIPNIEETPIPSPEIVSLDIEKRKKLNGWNASYELAKVAKGQGINLSTLSRKEYVDFAIQNFLAIDDSQLRMPPWQRTCTSVEEILAANKEKRKQITEESGKTFDRFCYEVQKKAGEEDRFIQERIRVRAGTKDSNAWLFFKINDGITQKSKETFKSYISVRDLNKLTPERFTSLMIALRDAGYNGDIKIFQDLVMQGVNLNDQIVMHGASENDAKLALGVAEQFFGEDLDQKSMGKDEVIDGENQSYSQVLARKIRNAINPPKTKI